MPETAEPGTRCRPQDWHKEAWTRLRRNVRCSRQHHALLIEGAPGTGRRAFADAAAALLLCSTPEEDGNCGHCRACALRAAGSHGDLLSVEPLEEGKAIGIDAIRSAIAFANGTPTLGECKVLLIAPAQSLTTAAFNAFLKCLEEPAPGTFILLVSARGHALPATIRSRCQRVTLAVPTVDEASAWLTENLSILAREEGRLVDDEQIAALLRLAPRRPLELLDLSRGADADASLALDAALRGTTTGGSALHLEQAAQAVAPERLIDITENALRQRLRRLPLVQLRSAAAVGSLKGLERLERLRSALRAGQNPNAELLRAEVIAAFLNGIEDGIESHPT